MKCKNKCYYIFIISLHIISIISSLGVKLKLQKTSVKKDKNLNEFVNYLYENTYGESINKIEVFLKYPI